MHKDMTHNDYDYWQHGLSTFTVNLAISGIVLTYCICAHCPWHPFFSLRVGMVNASEDLKCQQSDTQHYV